jgi:outer membrane protein assembly factor BamB
VALTFDPEQPFLGLKKLIGDSELRNNTLVSQWLLVGGNPSRNARRVDGFPTFPAVWSSPRLLNDLEKQKVTRVRDALALSKASSLIPAAVPLALNGTTLIQTQKHIVGIDISSGKRIWSVPPQDDLDSNGQGAGWADEKSTDRRVQEGEQLPWADFLRGHFSSDGRMVFRISTKEPAASEDKYVPRFNRSATAENQWNQLEAFDVSRQGAIVWRVGGLDGLDDPKLDDTKFLGAPLPIGDTLYAIARRRQETVLLAINKWTGKLVWSQNLVTNENMRSNRYSYRRTEDNRSLTPSYANGMLLCPTGQSSIVAIDVATRSFLWGAQATSSESSRSRNSSRLYRTQNTQMIVDGSRVIAMDVSEYPRLLTLDLKTGRPVGRTGKTGLRLTDAFFIACVDSDAVVIVEQTRVRAITIKTGRKKWETSIRSFGRPTGRGYASRDAYYLPTEENLVIKLALTDGEIVDSVRTDGPLGNLVECQGKIISLSDTTAACFDSDSGVAKQIEAAIELAGDVNKISPALRIKQAALLNQTGERKAALRLLEAIPEAERPSRFERQVLTIVLDLLADLPADGVELVEKWGDRYDRTLYPNLYLTFVEHLVATGNADTAIGLLIPMDFQLPMAGHHIDDLGNVVEPENKLRLSDYDVDDAKPSSGTSKFNPGDSKSMTVSDAQWRRIQLLKLAFNLPESIPAIEKRIDEVFAKNELADDVQRYRFLRSFPLEHVSQDTRFELAKSATENGEISIAENLLASLLGFSPDSRSDFAETAAQFDGKQSLYAAAWTQLIEARDKTVVGSGPIVGGGDEPNDDLKRNVKPVDFDRVELSVANSSSRYDPNQVFEVRLNQQSKYRALADKSLVIWNKSKECELFGGFNETLCRTTLMTSQGADSQSLLSGISEIYANHSLATIRRGNLLVGVDLSKFNDRGSDGFRCWSRTLMSSSSRQQRVAGEFDLINNGVSSESGFEASSALHARCCFIDSDHLVCIDAFSGETLWRRPVETNHNDLLSNDDAIISIDSRLRSATFIDWKTGFKMKSMKLPDRLEKIWFGDGDEFVASNVVRESVLSELVDVVDYRTKPDPIITSPEGSKEEIERIVDRSDNSSDRFVARFSTQSESYLWKKQFDLQAKITRLSDNRFLALTHDNQVIIFDSVSGKELNRFDSGLSKETKAITKGVGAVRMGDRDLVVFSTVQQSSIMDGTNRIRASRRMNTLFAGNAIAIDPKNNQPLWSRPVELNGFQLLPFTPVQSPILLLSRTIQPNQKQDAMKLMVPQFQQNVDDIPANAFQLVGLDWESGKLLLNEFVGSVNGQKHVPVTYDLDSETMLISLQNHEATLSFHRAADLPPRPPASLAASNSMPRSAKTETPLVAISKSPAVDFEKLNQGLVERAQRYEATLGDRGKIELERLRLEAEVN